MQQHPFQDWIKSITIWHFWSGILNIMVTHLYKYKWLIEIKILHCPLCFLQYKCLVFLTRIIKCMPCLFCNLLKTKIHDSLTQYNSWLTWFSLWHRHMKTSLLIKMTLKMCQNNPRERCMNRYRCAKQQEEKNRKRIWQILPVHCWGIKRRRIKYRGGWWKESRIGHDPRRRRGYCWKED